MDIHIGIDRKRKIIKVGIATGIGISKKHR